MAKVHQGDNIDLGMHISVYEARGSIQGLLIVVKVYKLYIRLGVVVVVVVGNVNII